MKKEVWQAHVDAYNSCKKSVTTYASQHGLVYSQMLYWTRKLSNEPPKADEPKPKIKPKSEFFAVEVMGSTSIPSVLSVLEFPGSIKLQIHNVELLSGIPNLWTGKP
ncbi:MAG: hypothetical protein ACI9Y1_003604 [Lentisphaeria bacterium]|jgi:hypothetical protein